MAVAGPAENAPAVHAGLRATDFLAAQRANRRNTLWLIFILVVLGGIFGYVIGWFIDAQLAAHAGQPLDLSPRVPVPPIGTDAILFVSELGILVGGALMSVGLVAMAATFQFGDRMILGITGARTVNAEEEPMLHNIVEEMAIAAGLPKPRIALIETDVPNAFAAGMDPKHAAIGVTRGLIDKLNRDELQGVIGHEMAHIANWDTHYMTAVAIMVGLIALVADGVLRVARASLRSGGSGGRSRGKGGGLGLLVLGVFVLVFAVLAPIAAQMVRFAVSRQREYLADATSVQFTRHPLGLIGALEKLAAEQRPFPGANRATQHMFIVNPFKAFGLDASALMSTHPPLQSRIERLRNLGPA
jgi:heat shock protein HtpX